MGFSNIILPLCSLFEKKHKKKKPERKSTNIMVSVSVFVIMWQIVTARKFKTFIDKE